MACVFLTLVPAEAASDAEIRELIEQNRRLQEQVKTQQRTIDELAGQVAEMRRTSERHETTLRSLQDQGPTAPAAGRGVAPDRTSEVRIAAELGLAYFRTGSEGQFPGGSFRADDPVISIEAPVAKRTYFYTELRLLPRDANVETADLGELYVDFEDVLGSFGQPGLLSVRVGRVNIPFGEEYLVRTPVANPLISHSLSDIWGVDEGVEIYGRAGPFNYVVAAQNGGVSRLRDATSDKSLTARVGWNPVPWLHLSASAMRTGNLDVVGDNLSEVWFANGFIRALGPAATTTTFWASLRQLDAVGRWKSGHLGVNWGEVRFDDNDRVANNARQMRYGAVELVQNFTQSWYGAARYSEIAAPAGYPLSGWGRMGVYFFRPLFTTGLQRLSVGMGYRLSAPVVLKVEYTSESGRMTTGARRDHENFFGSELAVKF
jgi:hypothetical protein